MVLDSVVRGCRVIFTDHGSRVVRHLSEEVMSLGGWRSTMTSAEGELLARVTGEFCEKLARVTAETLVQFPADLEDYILMALQDATSLYSPYTADRIRVEIRRLRAKE
jgi:hypothetical protein